RVARSGAQLVGALGVQVDLPRPEVGEGDGLAAGSNITEALQASRIAREEHHARLVLPARDVLYGDSLEDHGRDPVDETRAARCIGDSVRVTRREIPRTGRVVRGGEGGLDTLRGNDLIGLPERRDGRGAN